MGLSSGPWPKKEDWLKKKDRNQRRPGRRRSQEEGGGACEPPPRAGPAAAKHLKLQQQQVARGRAWRGVATGGDLHHRWARRQAPAVRGRAPATGPSPSPSPPLSHFPLLVGRDRRKKTG